jgi:rhodanese-related sulfurtransferase
MFHAARSIAPALAAVTLALAPLPALSQPLDLQDPVRAEDLPDSKHTTPGLYITAAEAGRVLEDHDSVALIDVRAPSEIMLIGYPTPTAASIPSRIVDPEINEASKEGTYKMVKNPDFEAEFQAWLASDAARDVETLMISCRSGSRSAAAIERLVEAGVDLPIYNMIDGFEGDKNDDGVRDVNGWRNAGLPWTYEIRDGLRPDLN